MPKLIQFIFPEQKIRSAPRAQYIPFEKYIYVLLHQYEVSARRIYCRRKKKSAQVAGDMQQNSYGRCSNTIECADIDRET